MAQSLHKTKRRIASVNSTKKITKAMELVATVKLKKFKDVMTRNSLYSDELINLIHNLFSSCEDSYDNKYINEGKSNETLYVIVNSNLGLCASFNNDIYNYVIKNVPKENSTICTVGLKGQNFYSKEGYKVIDSYTSLNEKLVYEDVLKFGNYLHSEFLSNKYKRVELIYTKYVNSIKFVPNMITLFPIKNEEKKFVLEPIFDPSVTNLIETLVPIYVVSTIYQKIIESQVSEQASRRTAMENATDNADEIIDELTLEYNKARQTAITQEISEVVSGTIK